MAEAISRTSYFPGRSSINGQLNFTSITININYSPTQQDQYISISPSSSSQYQNMILMNSFIFPAMLEFLQLKYQTSNTSLFEIHPIKMYLAIVSFLIFSFAYDAQIKYISTTYSNYAKVVGDIFGSLALASYSSLLYPPFSTQPLSYTLQLTC
ncbi:hypothetical protein KY284_033730 [Solanum tuberosum]|nr:hypothetical protein KY284_033730 [Solanum tuberosum]